MGSLSSVLTFIRPWPQFTQLTAIGMTGVGGGRSDQELGSPIGIWCLKIYIVFDIFTIFYILYLLQETVNVTLPLFSSCHCLNTAVSGLSSLVLMYISSAIHMISTVEVVERESVKPL